MPTPTGTTGSCTCTRTLICTNTGMTRTARGPAPARRALLHHDLDQGRLRRLADRVDRRAGGVHGLHHLQVGVAALGPDANDAVGGRAQPLDLVESGDPRAHHADEDDLSLAAARGDIEQRGAA